MKRLLAVAAVAAMAFAGSASAGPATLTVIHGIPGLPAPVTVAVNGADAFSFGFKQSQGPLSLPAGAYSFEVKLQGAVVLAADVTLEEDKNYTAIAHLTSNGGAPAGIKLSLFENNVTDAGSYRSRLTVRHTADAPAVDVDVRRVIKWWNRYAQFFFIKGFDLSNESAGAPGQFGPVELMSGMVVAGLSPAGTGNEIFTSPILTLKPQTSYIVYAIGSLAGGTFDLFIQPVVL
jgi:hypothetical protein